MPLRKRCPSYEFDQPRAGPFAFVFVDDHQSDIEAIVFLLYRHGSLLPFGNNVLCLLLGKFAMALEGVWRRKDSDTLRINTRHFIGFSINPVSLHIFGTGNKAPETWLSMTDPQFEPQLPEVFWVACFRPFVVPILNDLAGYAEDINSQLYSEGGRR
jgi:hypothetical protein